MSEPDVNEALGRARENEREEREEEIDDKIVQTKRLADALTAGDERRADPEPTD